MLESIKKIGERVESRRVRVMNRILRSGVDVIVAGDGEES